MAWKDKSHWSWIRAEEAVGREEDIDFEREGEGVQNKRAEDKITEKIGQA